MFMCGAKAGPVPPALLYQVQCAVVRSCTEAASFHQVWEAMASPCSPLLHGMTSYSRTRQQDLAKASIHDQVAQQRSCVLFHVASVERRAAAWCRGFSRVAQGCCRSITSNKLGTVSAGGRV